MKITIYELLGLIKDGKAPKKIKFCGNIYEWEDDWYLTKEKNYKVCLGGKEEDCNILINSFNENVEIIEDPKKIEKITVREKTLGFPNGEWTARNMDKAFAIKINELIDEVNKLKEK